MKKIIALLLVLVMCVGLFAACGPAYDVESAAEYLHNMYIYDEGKDTPNNYQLVGVVIIEGLTYTVEWTANSTDITFEKSTDGKLVTVKVPNPNAEAFGYELTAKISAPNGQSAEEKFTRTMPVTAKDLSSSALQEDVAYKLYLYQAALSKTLFALNTTQDNGNKFINTTEDPSEAADFYVEAVEGGFKIYTDIAGTKTYVYAKTETDEEAHISKFIGFSATEGSVFFYDEERGGVWMVTIDGADYGVGTYSTYYTISLSEEGRFSTSSVGDSQFVMKFMTSEDAEDFVPETPDTVTDAATILNQLYALADGASASGSFQLTGTITELDSYNNPTIVVTGFENKPVYCYRLTDSRFVVGATITVTATSMKNYSGTYEFMNCVLDSFTAPGVEVDPPANSNTYNSVTTLNNGDKVVIGAANYGKLLSMVKTGYYNVGVDYSVSDFSNVTDDEIFVVTVNNDGSYTFTSVSGKVLALAASYSSLNHEDPVNSTWSLETQNNGTFYVKNDGRGNYLEWYNDMSNWSTFSTASSDLFEMTFYLVEGAEDGGVTPPAGGGDEVDPPSGGGDEVDPPEPVDSTIADVIVIANAQEHDTYTTVLYKVTGVISAIGDATTGNFYIKDENGNTIQVYGLTNQDGVAFGSLDVVPAVRDTVTIYGAVGKYYSNVQFKNAILVSHTVAEPENSDNLLFEGTIVSKVMSDNLTYVPAGTESAAYYADGGLKLNKVNMGVKTASFEAQTSVTVTYSILALNANQQASNGSAAFTIYGLDASGNVVATVTSDAAVVGDNTVVVEGEGIVAIKFVMTNWPVSSGTTLANVSLSGIKVEKNA